MKTAYQSGFSVGHDAGEAHAKAILESIRHLPRDEQMAVLKAEERRLKESLERNPDFQRMQRLDSMVNDIEALKATMAGWDAGRYRLGRLPHSMMHKLLEAAQQGRIEFGLQGQDEASCKADFTSRLKRSIPFVIEHNWTAAFAGATDFDDGEFSLPFDDTVFEVAADGRHVALFYGPEDGPLIAVQLGGGWFVSRCSSETPSWLGALVRSACIALDAEVAITEAIRAPDRLNRSRAKKGKPPLLDYHVVRLAKRARLAPLEGEFSTTGRHLRLHFVRGHWRHYETHKTWIKWHLRGDPDLGFIDKHYRL